MHGADLLPMLFVGGVFLLLTGRVVYEYLKAKFA